MPGIYPFRKTDVKTFHTAPGMGRIAIAPDGYLYHLTICATAAACTSAAGGWVANSMEIVRWELPKTL